jgi:hypothetical protein
MGEVDRWKDRVYNELGSWSRKAFNKVSKVGKTLKKRGWANGYPKGV